MGMRVLWGGGGGEGKNGVDVCWLGKKKRGKIRVMKWLSCIVGRK